MTDEDLKRETEEGERELEKAAHKDFPMFIWIPEFISLAGSLMYEREADREPGDIDIVVRAHERDDRFEIRLDPSLRLKLDRVLERNFGEKSVQWIGSTFGPNWRYRPLYDLALVPHTPAETREINEPGFAEKFYKGSLHKLDIRTFRAEGIDDDIRQPKRRWRELLADLRYLGNSGYPRLKAGESWGEWTLADVLKYFAKIVDTLRSIYFPVMPPKIGDRRFNTAYWQAYRAARPQMKSKPPASGQVKEWDARRAELLKAAFPPGKGIYLVEPHGQLIADGKKTLIVKAKALPAAYLDESVYLCSGGKVLGLITVKSKPGEISQAEFKRLRAQHKISDDEAAKWSFAEKDKLLAYEFLFEEAFTPPRAYKHPQGAQAVIREVDFEKAAFFKIIKLDKRQQIAGGVVYEPDVEDTQGDLASAKEIQRAMYRFMERYAKDTHRIKVLHKGRRYFFPVLECFQPERDTVKGGEIVPAGAWWLMIKVANKSIWNRIEKGELSGFSMGGIATKA